MPFRATQDGRAIVKNSDKTGASGEGNGNPLQYSCLRNPTDSMRRQKDMTLEDETSRSVDVQYATWEEKRNSYRENEQAGSKQK